MADPAPPRPLLGPGSRFEGLVVLHGQARIEGRIRGEVIGARRLEIGEGARLEADVEAEELVVAGAVEGGIRAARRLELTPTARVRGPVETPRLRVAEGARLDGSWRVGAPSPRAADGAPDAPASA